ncbi:MAG: hypothetical protein ACE5JF_08975, partial [Anaerolineales bacterium]
MSTVSERARTEWLWVAIALALAILLAALEPAGDFLGGVLTYAALFFFGGLLLRATLGWLRPSEASRPLAAAVGAAIILRLLFGLIFTQSLPRLGYPDSEPHIHGYYYLDAYDRDRDAWRIAHDDLPISGAFTNPERSDQYGGLLFITALAYRTLSPEVQRQMLIVGMSAVAGGLAVLFGWGFTFRRFGAAPALVAAWILAIFPEAIFLGASPMREPFLIAALAASLYGYALFRDGKRSPGIVTMLVALALTTALSPPYALLFAGTLLVAWVWEGGRRSVRIILVTGAVIGIALVLTIGAWSQIGTAPQGSPIGLLDWWINSGAQFELHKLERGSGLVQKYFELAPEWAHMPMATAYGLVQPFLPATLMDATSLPLPRLLGVLRGLGWFALLPLLIYAPFAAVKTAGWRSLQAYLSLLIWLIAIGAAYRLAGDQWDNPRARAVYLAVQAAISGWVWFQAKQSPSPWLRRVIIVVAVATLVFLQWYAGRYYQTPRLNL